MSTELSKQKLDIDKMARSIQSLMHDLSIKHRILLAGIKAIDDNNENMLESNSTLAQEVREIMRNPLDK